MRKSLLLAISLFITLLSPIVFANDISWDSCKHIMSACQAAGYFKGGSITGQGVWKNCIIPIMSGKNVKGVKINPSDVQACNAKKTSLHNKFLF